MALVLFKFKYFDSFGREMMGSISLTPLHGSTGATVHIYKPAKTSPCTSTKHTREQTGFGCVSEE